MARKSKYDDEDDLFGDDSFFDDLDDDEMDKPPKGIKGYFVNVAKSVGRGVVKLSEGLLPQTTEILRGVGDAGDEARSQVADAKEKMMKQMAKAGIHKQILGMKDMSKNVSGGDAKAQSANWFKNIASDVTKRIKTGEFIKGESFSMDFGDDDDDSGSDYSDDEDEREEEDTSQVNYEMSGNYTRALGKKLMISDTKNTAKIMNTTISSTVSNIQSREKIFKTNVALEEARHSDNIKIMSNIATNIYKLTNVTASNFKMQYEYSTKQLALQRDILALKKEIHKTYFPDEVDDSAERGPMAKDIFGDGGFSGRDYIERVKRNANDAFESSALGQMTTMMSMMGSMGGGVKGMLKSAISPVDIVKALVLSPEAKMGLESLDKNFMNIPKLINARFLKEKDKGGLLGGLAGILGIEDDDDNLDVLKYANKKDLNQAVPFDQMTKIAITEVIPNYLSQIVAGVTGKEQAIFDYNRRSFVGASSIRRQMKDNEDIMFNQDSDLNDMKDKLIKDTMKNTTGVSAKDIAKGFEIITRNIVKTKIDFEPSRVVNGIPDTNYIEQLAVGVHKNPEVAKGLVHEYALSVKRHMDENYEGGHIPLGSYNSSVLNLGMQIADGHAAIAQNLVDSGATTAALQIQAGDDAQTLRDKLTQIQKKIKTLPPKDPQINGLRERELSITNALRAKNESVGLVNDNAGDMSDAKVVKSAQYDKMTSTVPGILQSMLSMMAEGLVVFTLPYSKADKDYMTERRRLSRHISGKRAKELELEKEDQSEYEKLKEDSINNIKEQQDSSISSSSKDFGLSKFGPLAALNNLIIGGADGGIGILGKLFGSNSVHSKKISEEAKEIDESDMFTSLDKTFDKGIEKGGFLGKLAGIGKKITDKGREAGIANRSRDHSKDGDLSGMFGKLYKKATSFLSDKVTNSSPVARNFVERLDEKTGFNKRSDSAGDVLILTDEKERELIKDLVSAGGFIVVTDTGKFESSCCVYISESVRDSEEGKSLGNRVEEKNKKLGAEKKRLIGYAETPKKLSAALKVILQDIEKSIMSDIKEDARSYEETLDDDTYDDTSYASTSSKKSKTKANKGRRKTRKGKPDNNMISMSTHSESHGVSAAAKPTNIGPIVTRTDTIIGILRSIEKNGIRSIGGGGGSNKNGEHRKLTKQEKKERRSRDKRKRRGGFGNALGSAAGGAIRVGGKVIGGGVDLIKALGSGAINVGGKALGAGFDLAGALGSNVINVGGKLLGAGATGIGKLMEHGIPLAGSLAGAGIAGARKLGGGAFDLAKMVGGGAKNAVFGRKAVVDKDGNDIDEGSQGMLGHGKDAIEGIGGFVKDKFGNPIKKGKEALSKGAEFMSNVFGGFGGLGFGGGLKGYMKIIAESTLATRMILAKVHGDVEVGDITDLAKTAAGPGLLSKVANGVGSALKSVGDKAAIGVKRTGKKASDSVKGATEGSFADMAADKKREDAEALTMADVESNLTTAENTERIANALEGGALNGQSPGTGGGGVGGAVIGGALASAGTWLLKKIIPKKMQVRLRKMGFGPFKKKGAKSVSKLSKLKNAGKGIKSLGSKMFNLGKSIGSKAKGIARFVGKGASAIGKGIKGALKGGKLVNLIGKLGPKLQSFVKSLQPILQKLPAIGKWFKNGGKLAKLIPTIGKVLLNVFNTVKGIAIKLTGRAAAQATAGVAARSAAGATAGAVTGGLMIAAFAAVGAVEGWWKAKRTFKTETPSLNQKLSNALAFALNSTLLGIPGFILGLVDRTGDSGEDVFSRLMCGQLPNIDKAVDEKDTKKDEDGETAEDIKDQGDVPSEDEVKAKSSTSTLLGKLFGKSSSLKDRGSAVVGLAKGLVGKGVGLLKSGIVKLIGAATKVVKFIGKVLPKLPGGFNKLFGKNGSSVKSVPSIQKGIINALNTLKTNVEKIDNEEAASLMLKIAPRLLALKVGGPLLIIAMIVSAKKGLSAASKIFKTKNASITQKVASAIGFGINTALCGIPALILEAVQSTSSTKDDTSTGDDGDEGLSPMESFAAYVAAHGMPDLDKEANAELASSAGLDANGKPISDTSSVTKPSLTGGFGSDDVSIPSSLTGVASTQLGSKLLSRVEASKNSMSTNGSSADGTGSEPVSKEVSALAKDIIKKINNGLRNFKKTYKAVLKIIPGFGKLPSSGIGLMTTVVFSSLKKVTAKLYDQLVKLDPLVLKELNGGEEPKKGIASKIIGFFKNIFSKPKADVSSATAAAERGVSMASDIFRTGNPNSVQILASATAFHINSLTDDIPSKILSKIETRSQGNETLAKMIFNLLPGNTILAILEGKASIDGIGKLYGATREHSGGSGGSSGGGDRMLGGGDTGPGAGNGSHAEVATRGSGAAPVGSDGKRLNEDSVELTDLEVKGGITKLGAVKGLKISQYLMPLTYKINGVMKPTIRARTGANEISKDSKNFKYIVIHNTGSKAPGASAANIHKWRCGESSVLVSSSWHYTVDEKEALQLIPLNVLCWSSGYGGSDNHRKLPELGGTRAVRKHSIDVEICDFSDPMRMKGSHDNAVILCAAILRTFRVSSSDASRYIVTHRDVSGKNCPFYLYTGRVPDYDVESFKMAVCNALRLMEGNPGAVVDANELGEDSDSSGAGTESTGDSSSSSNSNSTGSDVNTVAAGEGLMHHPPRVQKYSSKNGEDVTGDKPSGTGVPKLNSSPGSSAQNKENAENLRTVMTELLVEQQRHNAINETQIGAIGELLAQAASSLQKMANKPEPSAALSILNSISEGN